VKAKAQWAEDHGFVWFSVLDHMIQIPRIGAPDEPFLEAGPCSRLCPRELFASDVMPHFA
jgi:hypothetical protein